MIGMGTTSETFLPEYVDIGQYRLYDIAGIGDTRGPLRSMVTASLLSGLFGEALSVRIIFVISQDEILASRGVFFRDTIRIMNTLLPTSHLPSMSGIIITRTVPNINPEVYMQYLQTKVEDQILVPWSKQWTKLSFGQLDVEECKKIKTLLFHDAFRPVSEVNVSVLLRNVERYSVYEFYQKEVKKIVEEISIQTQLKTQSKTLKSELKSLKEWISDHFESSIKDKFMDQDSVRILQPVTQDILKASLEDFQFIIQQEKKKLIAECQIIEEHFNTKEAEDATEEERKTRQHAEQLADQFRSQADVQERLVNEKHEELVKERQEKSNMMQQYASLESQIAKQQLEMQATVSKLQAELTKALENDNDDCSFGIKLGPISFKIKI